ncbi:MAG: hypothetical protein KC501_26625 [Myxococcales bacterium]|nr:hypothetical protein [Myxococcales bacterium]
MACRGGDDGEPMRTEGGGGGGMMLTSGPPDHGTSTGEVYEPSRDATDQCDLAPLIGAGTHYGSLRGNASELGGACGEGGPDAFFRLEIPRRSDVSLRGLGAGFVPRVGVLPHECADAWDERTLLCTQGVGGWILDVAPGSSLVVSMGIDPDDPLIGQLPPMVGPDPLSFALEVKLRNVLDEGDPCGSIERGRCGTGTVCLPTPPPEDEPDAPPGPRVCTVVEGDTCESAIDLALGAGTTVVEIDPATPHTDAHHHSCGGARRRDRVLRLQLPGPGPHALDLRGDRPQLGFALRGPSCLPTDELACAADELEPAQLVAEISDPAVLLFVELPPAVEDDDEQGTSTGSPPGGEEAPIVVEIEVLEAPPAD